MINIKEKHNCCGCSACVSICGRSAIELKEDQEGFLYPSINEEDCVDCGLCDRVCPILRYDVKRTSQTKPMIYAVHHRDSVIWRTSSSGGVFSALADYVLSQHGCVFGAAYNNDFQVTHIKIEDKEHVKALRGSKYVQSNTTGIYEKVRAELRSGRLVLFSGTPCQVEGLKGFLLKHYDNLITVDLVCHCVASPKIFSDYIELLHRKKGGRIRTINMKDKTLGWGNQKIRIDFEDGTTWFNNPETNLWGELFYSQLISRPSCHMCRFANLERPGDITIGDFWGIERSHPTFHDRRGISLVLLNTDKGIKVFDPVKESCNYISCIEDECLQPSLLRPVAPSLKRDMFWSYYQKHSFRQTCVRFLHYGMRNQIKNRFIDLLRAIGLR